MTRKLRREAEVDTLLAKVISRTRSAFFVPAILSNQRVDGETIFDGSETIL